MKKRRRNCVPIDQITRGRGRIAHQNDIAFPNCDAYSVCIYTCAHVCADVTQRREDRQAGV